MARAWSIMSMSRYLVALISTIGVLLSAAAIYMFVQINESREAWHSYEHASAARSRALTDIVTSFGYGGLIHHFKNYVIRNDKKQVAQAGQSAQNVLNALHDLATQNPSEQEQAAIDALRKTVNDYTAALQAAQAAYIFGNTPEAVDEDLVVQDAEALSALQYLFELTEADELGGHPSKHFYIVTLKRELGYGGLIHQFKNYVLRKDEKRIALVASALEGVRASLAGYRSFDVTPSEQTALDDITTVINAYETAMEQAVAMVKQGKSVAEIDKAVKVSDAPALAGIATLVDAQMSETDQAADHLDLTLGKVESLALIVSVFVVAALGTTAFVTSHVLLRKIARPARHIATELDKLSKGDTSIDVDHMLSDTEIGAIARASQAFRENLLHAVELEEQQKDASQRERELLQENIVKEQKERAFADEVARVEKERLHEMELVQKEINDVIAHAVRGDFGHRANTKVSSATLSAMIDAINTLMTGIETSLGETGRVLKELAIGNLRARMDGDYEGVFAELQNNMNLTLHTLEDMVDAIASSGTTVARKSDDIRSAATALAHRTESSASSLEEAAASLEEISSTVTSVSENIERASESATEAEQNATTTSEVAERAVNSLDAAAATTTNINKIVSVIEDIAFQINLLALNAGVEAARAGDSGRGFAVVASEVRALAQRSSDAVGEITSVVDESTHAVENSVSMVAQAMEKVTEISTAIGTISRQTSEAAEAVNQQAKGLVSVSESITHLDAATQENAMLFDQVREDSEHLREQARALETALGKLAVQDQQRHRDPSIEEGAFAAE